MKLDCGHEPSPHCDSTTGYGEDDKGRKHCYDCCAERDVKQMDRDGRVTLYLGDGGVSNWPGSLFFKVDHQTTGRHNIAGIRRDVWFRDYNRRIWHGVQYGNFTQLCHCRRLKED